MLDTQRRLCLWFAAPVIAAVTCQDITVDHMQQIVDDAAPTASEGDRLHRCLSAMVSAGIKGGYLASLRAAGGALAGRGPARARARGQHLRGGRAVGRPGPHPRPRRNIHLLLPKTSSMLVGADAWVRPVLCAMAAAGRSCDRGLLWHGDRPCCCDWPISVWRTCSRCCGCCR